MPLLLLVTVLSESAEEAETRLFVFLVDGDKDVIVNIVIDCGEGIMTPVDENDDTNPTRVLLKSNILGGCNNCNINIVAADGRRSIVVVHCPLFVFVVATDPIRLLMIRSVCL